MTAKPEVPKREQASPGLGAGRQCPLPRGGTTTGNEFFPVTCILTFFLKKKIHFTNFFINSWKTHEAGEGKGQGACHYHHMRAPRDNFPPDTLLGSPGRAGNFPVGLVAGILVWGLGVCLFFILPVVVLSLRWKLNTESSYRKGGSDVSWDGSQVGPVWMDTRRRARPGTSPAQEVLMLAVHLAGRQSHQLACQLPRVRVSQLCPCCCTPLHPSEPSEGCGE